MGYVNRCNPQLLLNPADFHPHVHSQVGIEVAEWFIE